MEIDPMTSRLYLFLRAARGNWRNAAFLSCRSCPHRDKPCGGYLFAADRDGAPILFPAQAFRQITGETTEQEECAAALEREAFESLYADWLSWRVSDPGQCSLKQIGNISDAGKGGSKE